MKVMPSKQAQNHSTMVTLRTEESGRCRDLNVIRKRGEIVTTVFFRGMQHFYLKNAYSSIKIHDTIKLNIPKNRNQTAAETNNTLCRPTFVTFCNKKQCFYNQLLLRHYFGSWDELQWSCSCGEVTIVERLREQSHS